MDYASCRDKIKSGDIIAFTHTSWETLDDIQVQAVRTFTQSEYSHVAVAWVFAGRVFLIEAVMPKVRIIPLSNRLEEEGVYWIPTDVPMSEDELDASMKEVGVGAYSKWQAIQGQLETLDIGSDSEWQCAELTIAMRRLSGLDLGPKATPSKVVQKCLELGYQVNYITPLT
jgi:hypothetical protein